MPAAMPSREDAVRIAEQFLDERVRSCERFSTGLRHWVYDIEAASGQTLVVRMSDPAHRAELAGAVYWTRQLRWLDLLVAEVLHYDTDCPMPYMVLERLAGTDLGNTFDELTPQDLAEIAGAVAQMQHQAGTLPPASGYGYALHYTDELAPDWIDIVTHGVDRAEQRIRAGGIVDPSLVPIVRARVEDAAVALRAVAPRAFLHDATTKNVIVHNRQVSGLVDVDTMAFGDPLWAVALTRMSLLAAGRPTLYSDALGAAMDATSEPDLLDLYTAVFCLDFLGELGQTFNRSEPEPVNPQFHQHLESTLRKLVRAE